MKPRVSPTASRCVPSAAALARARPGADDVREPAAQEPEVACRRGRDARMSAVIACMTPTCPNMRSPSTSTATASATPACRSTRRPPPSTHRRRARGATRPCRCSRRCSALPHERVHLKTRRRQRAGAQYEAQGEAGQFHEVREGENRYLVNFTDYLDTGLFLDHRLTRALIGGKAAGTRFLNLFAYTGTATVCAARAGAASTTTIDMSHTYLDWARRNLALNGLASGAHEFVQADCLQWLAEQRTRRRRATG